MQEHNELNRSIGRLEGKLDSLIASVDTMAKEVKEHASFIGNLKGKIALASSGIALLTSLLTLWIKKHFFD